jgi:uncharacterized membrane protein
MTGDLPFIHTPTRARLIGLGAAAFGIVDTLVFAPKWIDGILRPVAAYDVGVIVLLVVMLTIAMHGDSKHTRCRAAVEDPGRNVMLAGVMSAVTIGLASAVVILGRGPHVTNASEKIAAYLIGLIAVIVGWMLIHVLFTFRYAHLFYFDSDDDNEHDGGLKFPGTEFPNDYDFAYFSFIIGMTFQVSDVEVLDSRVRRVVLVHSLISFAYNTAIVALVINILSGLFH